MTRARASARAPRRRMGLPGWLGCCGLVAALSACSDPPPRERETLHGSQVPHAEGRTAARQGSSGLVILGSIDDEGGPERAQRSVRTLRHLSKELQVIIVIDVGVIVDAADPRLLEVTPADAIDIIAQLNDCEVVEEPADHKLFLRR